MVDGWQFESSPVIYRGKHPKTWMKKAEEFYSNGIASPPKGDIGEIAGALYMFFCVDVLRYSLDKTMLTLRVPFEDWVCKLLNPDSSNLFPKESDLFVNIMQVCQNSLRNTDIFLQEKHVLSDWFNAGLAFYAPNQNFAYDIIAPIGVISEGQNDPDQFIPMIIQVKNWADVSPSNVIEFFAKIDDVFKKAGVETGVFIILMVGLDDPIKIQHFELNKQIDVQNSNLLDEYKSTQSFNERVAMWRQNVVTDNQGSILKMCIAVPKDDCFGVHHFSTTVALSSNHCSEIYSSNFVIRQLAKRNILDDEKKQKQSLRTDADKDITDSFVQMYKGMMKSS
jgi:hypothetical protein